jgi:hypothetical protein
MTKTSKLLDPKLKETNLMQIFGSKLGKSLSNME